MLGQFRMCWNGQTIELRSGDSTKVMQILQLLLFHAPHRVAREALMQQIFDQGDIASPGNNLKASISQLRRQLSESGLPKEELIRFESGGYSWNFSGTTEVDVHVFEDLVRRAGQGTRETREKQIELYQKAAQVYKGSFLPQLAGFDWAVGLEAYYNNMFSDAMHKLIGLLKEEKRYKEVLPAAEQAYRILQMDEWQVQRIECLMQLGEWEEAKRVYNETVTVLAKEFDLKPSEELLQRYQEICEKTSNAVNSFDNILKNIQEEEELGGAYFCTFPGFIDSCRTISRSMERSGISCFLMLFSIGDKNGQPLQKEERLKEASEKLRDAIQRSLRRSDFFTQYNTSQYMIFLMGTCQENCEIVAGRIESNFQRASVRGAYLFHETTSAISVEGGMLSALGTPPAWS